MSIFLVIFTFSIHCNVPAGQSWSKFEEFANYLEHSFMQFVFIKFSAILKHTSRLFLKYYFKLLVKISLKIIDFLRIYFSAYMIIISSSLMIKSGCGEYPPDLHPAVITIIFISIIIII